MYSQIPPWQQYKVRADQPDAFTIWKNKILDGGKFVTVYREDKWFVAVPRGKEITLVPIPNQEIQIEHRADITTADRVGLPLRTLNKGYNRSPVDKEKYRWYALAYTRRGQREG